MSYNNKDLVKLSNDAQKIIDKYSFERSSILPLLHLVQSKDGYISENGLEFVADVLNISPLEVKSVSSFYSMFKKNKQGKYVIGICSTALCAVMGGDELLSILSKYLKIKPGETTKDEMFTLEEIECNAACDFAPVAMVNWEFIDNANPKKLKSIIDNLKSGKKVSPTRSGSKDIKIKQFQEIARELSGIEE
jgi:NADH-quinone oxidoreductase subunit E